MNFGPKHYVPILKVKRGEKTALSHIAPTFRSSITPLLEIVERRAEKPIEKHLETAFRDLAQSLVGYPRCFLDVREIESDGSEAATAVFGRAVTSGIAFTPVTGVSRTVDVMPALGQQAHGLALRLTRSELETRDIAGAVHAFLEQHELRAEKVDLIIDLGAVEQLITAGIEALTDTFMANVPHHDKWRTFTVAACAFPRSLGGVNRNSHRLVERADWVVWKEHLHSRRSRLQRLPSFGDCAIQHPQGVEGFDPVTMQVSASVRYTTGTDWLLVKGESTRAIAPSIQFPDLARRLVYGHLCQHFIGAEHCPGCNGIGAAADGWGGYGSAEVWRRLGTIHHITHVMEDLDALPWP